MSIEHIFDDCICTNVCTIRRWPAPIYSVRPGVYFIIAKEAVLDLLAISFRDGVFGGFSHPVAVMDDFGDLVGVPK